MIARTPNDVLSMVSRETCERLTTFVRLTLHWNERLNLIGRADTATIWHRHVCDSLQLVPLVPPGIQSALDIGSGGGFPGLVLAIATGLPFTLVEADKRKAAFLREAARQTGTRVTVRAERIEHIAATKDLVTARAVAPVSQLLAWAAPVLTRDGFCLFSKGGNAASEYAIARQVWEFSLEVFPSTTRTEGVILRIAHLQRHTRPST